MIKELLRFAIMTGIVATVMFAEPPSPTERARLIEDAMASYRDGELAHPIPEEILTSDPASTLEFLSPFWADSSSVVRWRTCSFGARVGLATNRRNVRQEVVSRLVRACQDSEPLVWQHSAEYLLAFRAVDFSDETRDELRHLLGARNVPRQILLLAGVAELRDQLTHLESFLIDETKYEDGPHAGRWYGTQSWAGRLARARMGVDRDADRAVELVRREPSRVVQVTVLLEQLAYTHHPKAYRFIASFLDSDERLPAVKSTVPGTPVAQRAMDVLVRLVPGCPLQNEGVPRYNYTPEEIALVREWVRESF